MEEQVSPWVPRTSESPQTLTFGVMIFVTILDYYGDLNGYIFYIKLLLILDSFEPPLSPMAIHGLSPREQH